MASHLRFLTAATLAAFASAVSIGALVLLSPVAEGPIVAQADTPDAKANPCSHRAWLNLDRNCLSRRDLPWVSAREAAPTNAAPSANAATAPRADIAAEHAALAASPPEQPRQPAAAPDAQGEGQGQAQQQSVQQPIPEPQPLPALALQPTPLMPVVQQPALVPEVPAAQAPLPQREATVPTPEPPVARAPVRPRHAAKPAHEAPAAEATAKPQLAKKLARHDRAAKPSRSEALNAVRRFDSKLPEIPVSSYASDGTQRQIVIRPTSIQDVYYYSAPR